METIGTYAQSMGCMICDLWGGANVSIDPDAIVDADMDTSDELRWKAAGQEGAPKRQQC